jgi:hypothetical protein
MRTPLQTCIIPGTRRHAFRFAARGGNDESGASMRPAD